jgi:prophage regulatory protein
MNGIHILRRRDVRQRTGHCNSKIDKLESEGKFPQRVRLSERAVGWYEHEVDEYLASLPRAVDVRPDPAGDLAARGWDGNTSRKRAAEKAKADQAVTSDAA